MRLIDADKLKKAFIGNRYGTKAIEYVIDDAPTVDAEPVRHGHWENTRPDAPMFGFYYCSLCGRKRTSPQDRYCPNCGVKMDLEEENDKTN